MSKNTGLPYQRLDAPAKPPAPLPKPIYQGPGHYWCPSFDKNRRAKGIGYDVRFEEHGWRCYNRWCKNGWACQHATRITDYLLEEAIIEALPEAKTPTPAQRFMAQGGSLVSAFDYAACPPPTHQVTNRNRVKAGY
jgi:hypothetical protein